MAPLETSQSKRRSDRPETDGPTTAELLELFGDEYTRRVYEVIVEHPRSGRAVAEAAEISRPTAYRRLNDLHDAGLARRETTICDDGHHREKFEALDVSLSVSFNDGVEIAVGVTE
ncbi:helix-turn-helix domain-containing protein [Natrinema versiforme]|uniref:Transcriptional regulator n=1 Tax=Natrinema versiforme JCM 10478 TaxID=1227496 RepID=L9XNY9_9EURY|nr:helix-turn-helix domain-containing protein [Natrinema versiforme]ELY63126.1 transcriptional regulator [Natrinema versiforme JCM 10478]